MAIGTKNITLRHFHHYLKCSAVSRHHTGNALHLIAPMMKMQGCRAIKTTNGALKMFLK